MEFGIVNMFLVSHYTTKLAQELIDTFKDKVLLMGKINSLEQYQNC